MNSAIYDLLKKELTKVQKKRTELWDKLQYNHFADICDLRKEFRDIVKKHGILSDEARNYAIKNADKEKELFQEAKHINENHDKIFNEVMDLDRKIREFSQEIALMEIRVGK